MIRVLEPLAANVKKRLVKSPKVYVRDSGILHTLQEVDSLDELLGHPRIGESWEGLAVEHLAASSPTRRGSSLQQVRATLSSAASAWFRWTSSWGSNLTGIRDHQPGGYDPAACSRTLNSAPGRQLRTSTEAPIASASIRTSARPMPVPSAVRVSSPPTR